MVRGQREHDRGKPCHYYTRTRAASPRRDEPRSGETRSIVVAGLAPAMFVPPAMLYYLPPVTFVPPFMPLIHAVLHITPTVLHHHTIPIFSVMLKTEPPERTTGRTRWRRCIHWSWCIGWRGRRNRWADWNRSSRC